MTVVFRQITSRVMLCLYCMRDRLTLLKEHKSCHYIRPMQPHPELARPSASVIMSKVRKSINIIILSCFSLQLNTSSISQRHVFITISPCSKDFNWAFYHGSLNSDGKIILMTFSVSYNCLHSPLKRKSSPPPIRTKRLFHTS